MNEIERIEGLLDVLLEKDGIGKAYVKIRVEPVVKKRNTGEVYKHHQEIRERVVTEGELEDLLEDTDWSYSGTIDTAGDFHVRDRISKQVTCTERGEKL